MADEANEIHVELQLGVLVEGAPKIKGALDFAPSERTGRLLAKDLFLGPQVLGQLELQVEVAVIDGPDFPGERSENCVRGLSRESCHTV